jgi:hypothetical protein
VGSLWAKGAPVRDFHCYLLDGNGHVVLREDIEAADLDEAITLGFAALQKRATAAPSSVVGIEIWSGDQLLFSGKPP